MLRASLSESLVYYYYYYYYYIIIIIVLEIGNVIDIEDDHFWQCYKCATCAKR